MKPSLETKLVHFASRLLGMDPICSQVFNKVAINKSVVEESLVWMEATRKIGADDEYQLFLCRDFTRFAGVADRNESGVEQERVIKNNGGKIFTRAEVGVEMTAFEQKLAAEFQQNKDKAPDEPKVYLTDLHIVEPTFKRYQRKG